MLNVLEVSRKYQTLVQPSPEQDIPEKTQTQNGNSVDKEIDAR